MQAGNKKQVHPGDLVTLFNRIGTRVGLVIYVEARICRPELTYAHVLWSDGTMSYYTTHHVETVQR